MKDKILVFIIVVLLSINGYCQSVTCIQGKQQQPEAFHGTPQPSNEPGANNICSVFMPADPNEIIGTIGYDAPNSVDTFQWVSKSEYLPYTIYFENDPDFATAAAQRVEIRHKLHPRANYATFGVGSFGFGQNMFIVDDYPSSYQTRLDLTNDTAGFYVDVMAGVDIVTNEAFWIFQTIDPATGLPPIGIHDGFLPVNDSLHSGEGQVTFRIMPKEFQCVTGDTITAEAGIVFDVNDPVWTNKWVNTIDAGEPTTSVSGTLNVTQDSLILQFSGQDDNGGCGLKQFYLYVSENEQQYVQYGTYREGETATYPVLEGTYYRFISMGEDNVGNLEPVKALPDYEYGVMMCNLSVSAFPSEYGSVSGSGQFPKGTSVTVIAEPIQNYHLARWASEGITQSYEETYTFTITSDVELVALFEENEYPFMTQVHSLVSGWNWYSTYIDITGEEGLLLLEEGLGESGITIKTQTGFLDYEYIWYGNLESVNVNDMIMIEMAENKDLILNGTKINTMVNPVVLRPGWTWFGYPVTYDMSVETVFSNLSLNTNDVVKSQEGFSEYVDGLGWFGSLNTMSPGNGYVYNNTDADDITMIYPESNRGGELRENITSRNNYWVPNVNKYPTNMNMVGVVEINENEITTGDYEIGVFSDNDVRGSARPLYVEQLDRYLLFLTIYGEEDDELEFYLYDTDAKLRLVTPSMETESYVADTILGSVLNPYVLHFETLNTLDDNASEVLVYPNPTQNIVTVECNDMKYITVTSITGQTVQRIYGIDGGKYNLNMSNYPDGLYYLWIKTNEGDSYCRRIVKSR